MPLIAARDGSAAQGPLRGALVAAAQVLSFLFVSVLPFQSLTKIKFE
jgi:hypothetical protein